jgi:1-deoxy-D-xylulose-5-phosphate synthase
MVSSSANLFEALNLRYFGPIDGHNITKLVDTLNDLKISPVQNYYTLKRVKREKRIRAGRKRPN